MPSISMIGQCLARFFLLLFTVCVCILFVSEVKLQLVPQSNAWFALFFTETDSLYDCSSLIIRNGVTIIVYYWS